MKCAISGDNHFFACFISSWYVGLDEILPGWELAIGFAFSESKMAANLHNLYMNLRRAHDVFVLSLFVCYLRFSSLWPAFTLTVHINALYIESVHGREVHAT